MKHDPVRPTYYMGTIETLAYMEDKMSAEAFEGFLAGNVIKYISRYKHKNGVEDLRKCQVYLAKLIEQKGGQRTMNKKIERVQQFLETTIKVQHEQLYKNGFKKECELDHMDGFMLGQLELAREILRRLEKEETK
ncbi:DUF3310 domain-containing protein [Shouchella lonarensis]|uniref:Protein of unknwon function n=1 Tax=Shouchella lonarensis TaxID=1464122 RepID=A0A1G6ILV2_9BACI|nr:DUF3310 domain-containing protein [Shouchella lonarensis]SDC07467.1 Protein of unknwon function [Shouchella lonarensis]